jgi:predicted nucleic-acid-binding protein
MIAVDTNVLIRYITSEDEEQSIIATKLLDSYIGKEKAIFINNIVLCELIWVLVKGYKYQKEQIIKTLKLLLSSVEFEFENHELAFLALIEYEKAEADFSDILTGLINHYKNCSATYSFDQNALKLKYFKKI